MDIVKLQDLIFSTIRSYRVHFLLFLIVLFIGLTFAHPAILINDEWITSNQLHQLHEGHQIIVNEGKYGLYENGTMKEYFAARANVLGYSLFLPLISLPALCLVDLFGDNFVFLILYLWTIIALMIIISLHFFFREYTSIGKWRWTPLFIGVIFVLFFLNLFYYIPFSVNGPDSFPEVMAVVFTNILLLALAGTLIYEINRTLFDDPVFSLFGTIVCLFSSSYFFWSTGCKDHILGLLLISGVLLCLVKFQKTKERWYFPLAFLLCGTLAWARPELALWVFFFVCVIWGYLFIRLLQKKSGYGYFFWICSPLFTIFGALPFFLNNYLITKNVLLPPFTINGEYVGFVKHISPQLQQNGIISVSPFLQIITINNSIPSSIILEDLFSILFHPLNGSIGIFPLTPLSVVMAILAAVLVLSRKLQFSKEEKQTIAVIALLALSVFLAYAGKLHGLIVDTGITPDIRYLSPIYVPLTLLGLIILKRAQIICKNPINILKMMFVTCAFGIPLSLILMSKAYADPKVALELNSPLAAFFSIFIIFLAAITLFITTWNLFTKRGDKISSLLIALLCTVPFIWQIDASFYVWQFATAEGYPAWIPIIRILYTLFSSPLVPQ